MKRTITLVLLMATFLAAAEAQIPNASFENWTTTGGYSTPDGWDNFDSLTSLASVYTCEQGTTGAPHGSSFIMLTSKLVGSSNVPGLAQTGKYDLATKKPKYGYPYTGRPAALTGKWQYMAFGTDTGRIAVLLTKWNTTTGQRDEIGTAVYDLPGMVMSWASFSIPITYTSGDTPDSAVIALVSSNKSVTPGSYLYVDSLNFYGHVVGVPAVTKIKYNAQLLPNPAKDNLSVDLGATAIDAVKLQMMGIDGRTVAEATWDAGRRMYPVDVHTIAPGLYFVKLSVGEDTRTLRLVVE